MNTDRPRKPSHRLVPAILGKALVVLAFTSALALTFPTSAFGAVAPDAARTFLHPAENNQTKNLTLASGSYTFRVDADPNGYHVVEWYNTYSGGTPVSTAYLFYYDDVEFNVRESGWVRAEVYRSDILNHWYEWEASYRWNVTVSGPYTVLLDRQGGSGGSTSVTATYGQPMPSASAPSKTGYTFRGYYTGTGGIGTTYYNGDMSSARNWDKTQNTTLYAHWVLPDLIVDSVTEVAASYVSGDKISARARITNSGLGKAGSPKLYYYLGSRDGWNSTGPSKIVKNIEEGSVSSLDSGDSAEDIINLGGWPLPADVAPGQYRIWVKADYNNQVAESNDNNNWGNSTSFTVQAQHTITFDKQGGSGGTDRVTATYGQPMPSASAPSKTGYTFRGYYTGTGGGGTHYYNSDMSSARNWDGTQNTTLYAHWVLPDLIVESVTEVAVSYVPGDKINARARITNSGLGKAGSSKLYYYLGSRDGSNSTGPSKIVKNIEEGSVSGLDPGDSAEDNINLVGWPLPADVALGQFRIWVKADYNNQIAESNESNNWGSSPSFTVQAQHTITFDKQGGSGGTDRVTATYGQPMPSASAPSKTGYTFRGYYTGTGGGGTNYYNSDMSSARNWDGTQNTTLYARWVLPDLIVDSVTEVAASYVPGDKISARARITNSGLGKAGSSKLYYYLGSRDGSNSTGPSKIVKNIEEGSVSGLDSGDSAEDIINLGGWPLPADVAPGQYRIWVKADYNNQIAESNESNNWGSSPSFTIPADSGTILVTVSGPSAGEINASLLYLNGVEQQRKDSDLGTAPGSTTYSFSNVSYGSGYSVDAYCWDMWVGDTASFDLSSSSVSKTITALPKRPLTLTAYCSGGKVRFADATVKLFSWDGYRSHEHERASGTTDANGQWTVQAYPTTQARERYILRVYQGATNVWEKADVALANSSSGSSYSASTPVPPPSPVVITTPCPLPKGKVGVAYSQSFSATGATPPYTWTISGGALPPGLDLNSTSGVLSGTPTVADSYDFTVRCTAADNQSAERPCNATIAPPDIPQNTMPLVLDFVPGALWNSYSGWVGMQLRVGDAPLEVWELGRVFVEGNTQNHELCLIRVSDRTEVARATWTPTGGVHNQIKYVALAAPVTLAPNTQYYLASQEEAGGDSWYNHDTTVTTTDAALVQARVYSRDGNAWVPYGSSGPYSYGPVSLGYHALPCTETPLVTGFIPGASWNNYSGWVGMRLQVGANPMQVWELGRVFVEGNTQNHELRLIRVSDRTEVARATWTPSGGVHNQITYVALAAPVTLAPNTQYYLASQEEAGGDSWYNHETTVTTTGGAVVQAPVYSRDGRSWVAQGSGGSYSYGPVSLGYCAVAGQETALVTGFTEGDSWNTYTGWVGMQLQVGASPLEVTSLGRVYVAGSKASHELRLVRVSDRTEVARATWTPTGGVHNQITYVALATPVTLAPNTQYYLASQEAAGGDSWYNHDTTVTTTDAAVVQARVYSRDGSVWVPYGPSGPYSYGPVSLGYYALPCTERPLVTDFTPGTPWNHYSGWVGMRLQVGANPLQVWELGRVYVEGNTRNHELRLIRVPDRTEVARATWTPTGGVHNQIRYVALAEPVTLEPNTQYYLASQEEAGGDRWYNHETTVTTTGAAVVQARVYSSDGNVWVPYGSSGPYSYGPVSLGYCVSRGAGLSAAFKVGGARAGMGELESGLRGEGPVALKVALRNGHFVLGYTRSRLQSQYAYVIESSRNLNLWQPIGGQTHERVTAIDSETELVDIEVPIDATTTRRFYRVVLR